MGKLKDWAEEQNTFIKIEDGESITAVYKGFEVVSSRFDSDREVVYYRLEVSGKEKLWSTQSTSVARTFDGIKEGTEVTIRREGEGTKTVYHVTPEGAKRAA